VTAVGSLLSTADFSETNIVIDVPTMPMNLLATLGNTTVALTWNAPADDGGSAITGYNIYEGTAPGGESTTPLDNHSLTGCATSSGPSQCTVTGLINGTTYYFTVKALNAVGPSLASDGASATPALSPTSGYALAAADGGVFALGHAGFFGSIGGKRLDRPIVGVATTADGGGYWLVASDGGVFSFGDAHFYGSEGGKPLNKAVVGMAVDPVTGGYWLVASDGGVFSFNATFSGSLGGTRLDKPIVGMAADPVTGGYWLVAADGGVFSYHATFAGSLGGTHLAQPIVGMAADLSTGGYWLVAADGGVFCYDAAYAGSLGGTHLAQPIVGLAAG